MNRKTLPLLLIVALVSGTAGWFLHTPPAETPPATPAATVQAASAPKAAPVAVSPTAQVAAPSVAPAPVAPAATPTVTTASTPQTAAQAPVAAAAATTAPPAPSATPPELANVISELTTLVQSGDLVGVYENYMPPQKLAALTPDQKAFIENQIQQQLQGPNGQKVLQAQTEMIQSLSTLTPVMNSAGDHATFQVPTPKELAPAGANLPATLPVNFVKIDGRWYLDQ